ncbi:MAG: undecaprenyl-diphosphate phosphatase [Candidatus Bathyarchaeota archaeon]|nr:undecaprenyl-diphosphate phosphatase [Candidatus Bathyarchaeota archaeon]
MDSLTQTILLGIIQGITEWLPISSTGHLRLTEYFLSLDIPIFFDVILHIGTLAVIFIYFRKDIKNIASALVRLDFRTEEGRLVPLIAVGTVPTAAIGVAFGDQIESAFKTPITIAAMLTITGTLLYCSGKTHEKTETITPFAALLFGAAQGIAIIPGISRSGATIAVALLLGLKREKAFKFSFLLSIPAIIGALGLTIYTQHAELAASGLDWIEIAVGAAVAMAVGYLTLKLLWKTLQRGKFHLFAFYCWTLAILLAVLSFSGF